MRFVVTGTGRCGTGYTAALLTACGLPTGHERVFTLDGFQGWQDYRGGCSWLAAPLLATLPADILVLHQTRDPARVEASLARSGLFTDEASPYRAFAERHVGRFATAAEFMTRWEALIVGSGRVSASYRVEELADPARARRLVGMLGGDVSAVVAALAAVPRDLNH